MCVAIGQRAGAKTLTLQQLERGWRANPDGGGYAYLHPKTGRIHIRKFMKRGPFIKAYQRDHGLYGGESPFLVHMRIATHGKVMEDTAHPFRVDVEAGEMAFIHNGIIDNVIPMTDNFTSDTMVFRDYYLEEMPDGFLDNMAIVEMMEEFIGWSKMVFLVNSPHYADNMYILNEDDGYWDKDTWFSNRSCEKSKWSYKKHNSTTKRGGATIVKYYSDGWPRMDDIEEDSWLGRDRLASPWTGEVDPPLAMSVVVRDKMNELILNPAWEQTIDAAVANGYCRYCAFKPCCCHDTCYNCNHRMDTCTCDPFLSIEDMVSWVGAGEIELVRLEELKRAAEAEGKDIS